MQSTQFGTTGVPLKIDTLAKTGIPEATPRNTFCRRYHGGLAAGHTGLNEYLHQDKPAANYVRVLRGGQKRR